MCVGKVLVLGHGWAHDVEIGGMLSSTLSMQWTYSCHPFHPCGSLLHLTHHHLTHFISSPTGEITPSSLASSLPWVTLN